MSLEMEPDLEVSGSNRRAPDLPGLLVRLEALAGIAAEVRGVQPRRVQLVHAGQQLPGPADGLRLCVRHAALDANLGWTGQTWFVCRPRSQSIYTVCSNCRSLLPCSYIGHVEPVDRTQKQESGSPSPSPECSCSYLEVVAEGPVAKHLEEGVVVHVLAHVVQVVVLASRPDALRES